MKKKKIIYVLILVAMLIIIGISIVNINTKPIEKAKVDSANNSSISTNNQANAITVKREMKNVTADINNIIDIKEKMFIQQTNDIYLNLKEYENKTIKLEGFMYNYIDDEVNTQEYHYIVRKAPRMLWR